MVNIFQKIRKQLFSKNKVSQYLLYAIGEIILVVLGILIALKINNINTNKVNEQLEVNYLSAISDNLGEDILDLEERLAKDSLHLTAYTQLIQAFSVDSIKSNELALKFIIHNSAVINYFNPQNSVFEEMKSSGKLNLITGEALRFAILEYYNQSNKVVASQKVNNQYILENKQASIDKYLDMNSLVESQLPEQWQAEVDSFDNAFFNKALLDPEVEDFSRRISLMKAAVWINHNWKKNLLESATEVSIQIDEYLQTRDY